MASTRLPSTWVRLSSSHWLLVICDAIGRAASGLWAGLIDGGSGIFGDSVPGRYFTGAAVGLRNLRSGEPLSTVCVRLCKLTEVALSFLTHPKKIEWNILCYYFRYLLLFFFFFLFSVLKVPLCFNERSWHFSADILAFLPGIRACSILGTLCFARCGGKKNSPSKITQRYYPD